MALCSKHTLQLYLTEEALEEREGRGEREGGGGEEREEGSRRAGGFECVSLSTLFTGGECPFTPR